MSHLQNQHRRKFEKKFGFHSPQSQHHHQHHHRGELNEDEENSALNSVVTFTDLKLVKNHHHHPHAKHANAALSMRSVQSVDVDGAVSRAATTKVESSSAAMHTITLVLGANAAAVCLIFVVLGVVIFMRRRKMARDAAASEEAVAVNQLQWDGSDGLVVRHPPHRSLDGAALRVTLNPFDEDDDDDDMEDIDIYAPECQLDNDDTQEFREYNFDHALHLTIQDEESEAEGWSEDDRPCGGDGFQKLEWDDQL